MKIYTISLLLLIFFIGACDELEDAKRISNEPSYENYFIIESDTLYYSDGEIMHITPRVELELIHGYYSVIPEINFEVNKWAIYLFTDSVDIVPHENGANLEKQGKECAAIVIRGTKSFEHILSVNGDDTIVSNLSIGTLGLNISRKSLKLGEGLSLWTNVDKGNIEIIKKNNEFKINIKGISDKNESIKIHFNGKLNFYKPVTNIITLLDNDYRNYLYLPGLGTNGIMECDITSWEKNNLGNKKYDFDMNLYNKKIDSENVYSNSNEEKFYNTVNVNISPYSSINEPFPENWYDIGFNEFSLLMHIKHDYIINGKYENEIRIKNGHIRIEYFADSCRLRMNGHDFDSQINEYKLFYEGPCKKILLNE